MADAAPHSASRADVPRALREAAIAGLIALALFTPLVGFNTVQNIRNELVLETRWPLLATLVLIIAAGPFLAVAAGRAVARAPRVCAPTTSRPTGSPGSRPGSPRSRSASRSPTRSSSFCSPASPAA